MSDAPKPGIYQNVPFSEYLGWDAISNSSLSAAKRSMLHYYEQQPVEETPAMRLGTLCHAGKFEPLTIAQRFVVMPAFEEQVRKPNGELYDSPKLSKAYKELVEEFKATNKDKTVVFQSQYDAMLGMVRALAEHDRASKYLAVRQGTQVEVAIVWRDPETGLLCKGRMDAVQHDIGMVGDLKTAADVVGFEKTIFQRGYHRQAAFYLDGWATLTGCDLDYSITAVESSRPFGVRAAPLGEEAIEAGRDEYSDLLIKIAESRETKIWPGYSSPDEWRLPAWAVKSDDDVELIIGGEKVRL